MPSGWTWSGETRSQGKKGGDYWRREEGDNGSQWEEGVNGSHRERSTAATGRGRRAATGRGRRGSTAANTGGYSSSETDSDDDDSFSSADDSASTDSLLEEERTWVQPVRGMRRKDGGRPQNIDVQVGENT